MQSPFSKDSNIAKLIFKISYYIPNNKNIVYQLDSKK